jgi:2-keto-3-deoxygluconate permease
MPETRVKAGKLLKAMEKVPGGLVLAPLFAVSLVTTFAPGLLTLGGISTALFSGGATEAIIGMLLFLAGSQFAVSDIRPALKRGGLLTLVRLLLGVLTGIIVMRLWGIDGFFGLSALSLVITMVSCNPGVYIAVIHKHGDAVDLPAFGLLNLVAVPAMPLVILGAVDGMGFDYMCILTTLLPFLLGMLLGNLDPDLKRLFGSATPAVIFFAGINFGTVLDWKIALHSGLQGLALTAIYFLVSVPVFLFVDRVLLKRPGYAGMAMTALPGVAVVMPAIVARSLPAYAPYVERATGQISLAMALSSLIAMFVVRAALRRWGDAASAREKAG